MSGLSFVLTQTHTVHVRVHVRMSVVKATLLYCTWTDSTSRTSNLKVQLTIDYTWLSIKWCKTHAVHLTLQSQWTQVQLTIDYTWLSISGINTVHMMCPKTLKQRISNIQHQSNALCDYVRCKAATCLCTYICIILLSCMCAHVISLCMILHTLDK